MITANPPPSEATAVASADPDRAARLLEEAEQIARALPLDERALAPEDRAAAIPGPPPPPASSSARTRGLDYEYDCALALAVQRARALVHVGAVAASLDPAHAARLLEDALHPSWSQPAQRAAGYNHILEALVWHCPAEFGLLLARIVPPPAERLVADIEKLPAVTRALHHREFLDDVAPFIAKVAEVVAGAGIAGAEELIWPMGAPARDLALAKVATVAARTDSARAGQIALTVTGQPSRVPAQANWQREASPPPAMPGDQAIYSKVRALTEIAIVVAAAHPGRSVRLPDDAERAALPVTPRGTVRAGAPTRAETAAAQDDPAEAGQLLTEAEQWAHAINRGDLQGMALTSVKMAAAQTDPAQAGQLLTEAEQYARAISGAPARLEALGEVALAAARTNPAQAEEVIRSLPPDAPELAEVALVAARTDPACGERIAAASAGGYLQALVRAVVAVRAGPADAVPALEQAVEAAGNDPAHLAEIAMVVAPADPDRAEQITRTIKAGGGMTAGYWRARTLADLANVCLGDAPGQN